ncbi:MAG: dihydrolipoyllysine-residue acetyltransferase [Pseudomonadales bacterium]
MTTETVRVPDVGGAESVEVIEVSVSVGDSVELEQSLIVLESDKASMEVPSPSAGKISKLHVEEGATVTEGDAIVDIEIEGEAAAGGKEDEATPDVGVQAQSTVAEPDIPAAKQSAPPAASSIEKVLLPDIGEAEGVEAIEVSVAVGDTVAEGDSIVVLESDKASMEVPAPSAGVVHAVHVSEGDQLAQGSMLIELKVDAAGSTQSESHAPSPAPAPAASKAVAAEPAHDLPKIADAAVAQRQAGGDVHAGPAVRKLARELGVDLSRVKGSGPKSRILKDDVQAFIKAALKSGGAAGTSAVPAVPTIDFSQFGAIDQQPLSKLHKLTAQNMARSWLNVPHVTHFDDADITELEEFRASLKPDMEKRGVKLSPLPFIVKACAVALQMNPAFNASILPGGEQIAYKQYYHIGLAVDTPAGLMVPVLRDVNKKSIWEIAEEMTVLSTKARDRKLSPAEMQGACFTISSLGNIGGIGFTPIVNTPEVGILGVSRTAIKPVFIDGEFVPRKMLPLSLSYDHRAVNGAHAGRFMTDLCQLMADIRRQLL